MWSKRFRTPLSRWAEHLISRSIGGRATFSPASSPPPLPATLALMPTSGFRWRCFSMRPAARSTCGTRSMPARKRSTTRRCPDIIYRQRPQSSMLLPTSPTPSSMGNRRFPWVPIWTASQLRWTFLQWDSCRSQRGVHFVGRHSRFPSEARHSAAWFRGYLASQTDSPKRNHSLILRDTGPERRWRAKRGHLPNTSFQDVYRLWTSAHRKWIRVGVTSLGSLQGLRPQGHGAEARRVCWQVSSKSVSFRLTTPNRGNSPRASVVDIRLMLTS